MAAVRASSNAAESTYVLSISSRASPSAAMASCTARYTPVGGSMTTLPLASFTSVPSSLSLGLAGSPTTPLSSANAVDVAALFAVSVTVVSALSMVACPELKPSSVRNIPVAASFPSAGLPTKSSIAFRASASLTPRALSAP